MTRAQALLVVVGHPAVLLEDSSWRALLCHCFTQGAYRGAGADAIRARFRVDPSAAPAALQLLAGDEGAAPAAAEGDAELQRAIGQLAEMALLGAGDADRIFPDTLDEAFAALGEEDLAWRVML